MFSTDTHWPRLIQRWLESKGMWAQKLKEWTESSLLLFTCSQGWKTCLSSEVEKRVIKQLLSTALLHCTAYVAGYMYMATWEVEASRVLDMFCLSSRLHTRGHARNRRSMAMDGHFLGHRLHSSISRTGKLRALVWSVLSFFLQMMSLKRKGNTCSCTCWIHSVVPSSEDGCPKKQMWIFKLFLVSSKQKGRLTCIPSFDWGLWSINVVTSTKVSW